ncbi:hypothetical protein [Bacillus cereus]|uniref:hypothetical protein n=1 Tax=Bacillus cereus TaxID=1396 RepID=UPI0025B1CF83|nr:hypothetical protein [Bacillus cereus]WJX07505.1 hypothetical protein QTA68_11700 [Bacillus cereus]
MKIKIRFEHYEQLTLNEEVIIDGEQYTIYAQLETEEDENGRYLTYILERESDDKLFRMDVFLIRYGYDWYDLESSYQDNEIYEVKETLVKVKKWIPIEGGIE